MELFQTFAALQQRTVRIKSTPRWTIQISEPTGHSSCQVEVAVSGQSFLQMSPTECGEPECDRGTSQTRPKPTRFVEP